jgi:tetratricopeptide (TPR) repeat protein
VSATTALPRDPAADFLKLCMALAVIGALLTAVCAFVFRVLVFDPAPQTIAAADLVRAESDIDDNPTAAKYAAAAMAQADAGDIPGAQARLRQAETLKLTDEQNQSLAYADAYILALSGNTDAALARYLQVIDLTDSAYQTELDKGGDMNWAASGGRQDNWLYSVLACAEIYAAQQDNENALKYYDLYLAENATDAGTLIARGQVHLAAGDNKAAAKDFRAALKYLPGDAEATAGLQAATGDTGDTTEKQGE